MLKINLLPPRIKAARIKRLMILGAVAGAAVLLTIPAGFWYVKFAQVRVLQAKIKALDREAAEYAGIIEKVTELETQEAALAKKLEVLDKLLARQAGWIKVLEALSLSQSRARDLWLQQFTSRALTAAPDTGKTELTLNGYAYSIASVDDFVRAFQKSDLEPELTAAPTIRSAAQEGESVISFTVVFKFKV